MSDFADRALPHLPPAAARLGHLAARPKVVAALCIVALSGLGWAYLGLLAGSAAAQAQNWPALLAALCRPAATPGGGATGFALLFAMWSAMSLAMMLPSAAPTILTYAEIADTAWRKRAPVVTPFALVAGYAGVWLGFSFAMAALQIALIRVGALPADGQAGGLLAGVLFVAAGLYQFSSLKQACLRACQRPFPFFFANWKTTFRGVAALGLRQGGYCLGCCWAAMTLMLVVGMMNPVWMAALGLAMTAEKLSKRRAPSYGFGALTVAAGLVWIAAAWFEIGLW